MKGQQGVASEPVTDNDWMDEEISGAALPDARLKARLGKVIKQLSQNVGGSIPSALENWADIKGAYR
ncbi:MAG: transposase DNA-binding-containing protein [Lautropia sp.]|nr:transposase DNA-binding-containing protein [Lautropia sp.]